MLADRRAGMEYGDAFDLLRSLDFADEPSACRRVRVATRCDDHGHRVPCDQLWFLDLTELSAGHSKEQPGEIAVDQRHDGFALGVAEPNVVLDQLRPLRSEHQSRIEHAAKWRSRPRKG